MSVLDSSHQATIVNNNTVSPAPTPSATDDQSAGRRKWTANDAPLFPGYDDGTPARSKVSAREPDMATQDRQPAFQPPANEQSPMNTRVSYYDSCDCCLRNLLVQCGECAHTVYSCELPKCLALAIRFCGDNHCIFCSMAMFF